MAGLEPVSVLRRQLSWTMDANPHEVERIAKNARRLAMRHYDGDEPPVSGTELERYAYSERQSWELLMDELGIEYE